VDLIRNINEGHITTKMAKSFIDGMIRGNTISQQIKDKGKKRISDESVLKKYSQEIIKDNPEIVEDLKINIKAIEALIGRVMQKTKGQADPKITRKILKELLKIR
jgi:aspartyl-tRNA(Asn)/glutamyl-tRNA(Gln) amidotransferase subunit B